MLSPASGHPPVKPPLVWVRSARLMYHSHSYVHPPMYIQMSSVMSIMFQTFLTVVGSLNPYEVDLMFHGVILGYFT